MFSAPNLRSIDICDRPEFLPLISLFSTPNITVVVYGYARSKDLQEALSRIRVKELRLKFLFRPDIYRTSENLWLSLAYSDALETFPSLRSIEIHDRISSGSPGSTWATITKLTTLRELAIFERFVDVFEDVPEDAVRFLSKLQSVTLHGFKPAFALASRIGRAVM